MFRTFSNFVSRLRAPHPAIMSASITPALQSVSASARIEDYYIRVSERAVPQIRQAAGITQFDLVELILNGHYRSLRERAIGSTGAWFSTSDARAALADTARDLHLLVFDPEREALVVAYAKADPQAERLTITRVVTARHYEHARWQLLPADVCQDLCAQSVRSPMQCERILRAALGDRNPDSLPIIFCIQNDKRAVWVEVIDRDGRERRMGILPFEFKKMAAAALPHLDAFWVWMQSTRNEDDAPIDRSDILAVRFVAHNDPYEKTVTTAA